jgi:hypothetical protein
MTYLLLKLFSLLLIIPVGKLFLSWVALVF